MKVYHIFLNIICRNLKCLIENHLNILLFKLYHLLKIYLECHLLIINNTLIFNMLK